MWRDFFFWYIFFFLASHPAICSNDQQIKIKFHGVRCSTTFFFVPKPFFHNCMLVYNIVIKQLTLQYGFYDYFISKNYFIPTSCNTK